jgi:hypothetical protein
VAPESSRESLKHRIYPVIFGLAGLGLLLLLLSRFSIMAWIETAPPELQPQEEEADLAAPSPPSDIPPAPAAIAPASPDAVSEPADPVVPEEIAIAPANYRGKLRVSNQTIHPVRVALLSQLPSESEELSENAVVPVYREPAHWDFAPQEGSERGLILSLPDGELEMQSGDVVIAFAQDGSRRYWGPYVVGETDAPVWNAETSEWLLLIRP